MKIPGISLIATALSVYFERGEGGESQIQGESPPETPKCLKNVRLRRALQGGGESQSLNQKGESINTGFDSGTAFVFKIQTLVYVLEQV